MFYERNKIMYFNIFLCFPIGRVGTLTRCNILEDIIFQFFFWKIQLSVRITFMENQTMGYKVVVLLFFKTSHIKISCSRIKPDDFS